MHVSVTLSFIDGRDFSKWGPGDCLCEKNNNTVSFCFKKTSQTSHDDCIHSYLIQIKAI